jgi:mRNA interferase HigB
MHVISRKTLRKAEGKHADLVGPLGTWFKIAKAARWKNIEDVRKTYRDADPVGPYTVFNIKGNSYRLIVKIEYECDLIFIKAVQTHAEYDKGKWKT